jgi:hypothetical protein
LAAAGLPDGFHHAAAEIFRRQAQSSAAMADEQTLNAVIDALRAGGTP